MDRVAKPDGGFTYQPFSKREPVAGFVVSPYPELSEAMTVKEFTVKRLGQFIAHHHKMFDNPENHVGAWHDPVSNMVFLDVSIPTSSDAAARKAALFHDQKAYFYLAKGESITVNAKATSGGAIKVKKENATRKYRKESRRIYPFFTRACL